MTPEPEIWISDGPRQGGPPPRGAARGPGGRWGRWIAIIAGLVVLIGGIAAQRMISGPSGRSAEPSTGALVTPPPTSSHSSTEPGVTTSSGDSGSGPADLTRHGGSAVTGTGLGATRRPSTAPITTTVRPAPAVGDWELVGFQWSGDMGYGAAVVTYRPATGDVVTTPVPAINSNGPLSFIVTSDTAIVRPMDHVDGYIVPNGQPAHVAQDLLNLGGQLLPSANPNRMWTVSSQGDRLILDLVDRTGKDMGTFIEPPASLGVMGGELFTQDGAGFVLVNTVGGTYDLRPHEARLVTHGKVLAAGPSGYLVYECTDVGRCAAAVLDRTTGKRTALPEYRPSTWAIANPIQGVISPNGRYAAMLDFAPDWGRFELVDLRTGESTLIGRNPNNGAPMYGDAASILAFTPDSRFLLTAETGGVRIVDVSRKAVTGTLPVPPLAAIAIRPATSR